MMCHEGERVEGRMGVLRRGMGRKLAVLFANILMVEIEKKNNSNQRGS